MKKMLLILLMVGMLTSAEYCIGKPKVPCSNFKILSIKQMTEQGGDFIWLIGEVKNVGGVPGEPVLRVTGYDKDGSVTDTSDSHLNKGHDMSPGETVVFKIITIKRKGVKTFKYKIIRVVVWG